MYHSFGAGHSRYSATRGGGLGRGNWRGHHSSEPTATGTTPPPRGTLIERVTHEGLLSNPALRIVKPAIQKCQYVASFSWLRGEKPTIVIPGMPPKWAPLAVPQQLEEDSGSYFRDINAVHYPQHPIEPAVRSVLAQAPDLATDEVDVFACGSTMGNLLRFARKSAKPFQLIVETIGDTVFLIRRENSPDEKIMDVHGYGHTFPETYTKLDDCVKKADSHQRLIRYEFAGFQCIVRYEGDGYLPDHLGSGLRSGDVQRLPQLDGLKMVEGGKMVPQEAMFDVKTRSARRQLTLEDVLSGEIDRLWVRQIPNFVLAHHTSGVFHDVKVHDVRQKIRAWEETHQQEIKVLSAALAKILAMARSRPSERFEICSGTPGVLEIRHVGGDFPNALPDDLVRMWAKGADGQDGHEGESDDDADSGADSDAEGGFDLHSDEDDEQDFTACSEGCGYCGRCNY